MGEDAGAGDTSHEHSFGSPTGPLADEARKLLSTVQEWAQRTMPAPPSGHPGPECEWCPLCQFASILRGERPELSERVAEAGTALVNAFRALVDTATTPGAAPSGDPGRAPKPTPGPRVQRIKLDDET